MKFVQPLRASGFRILWLGMAVSLVGDGISLVGISWQVAELTSLPTALGLTMAAMAVPQLLLLLFAGALSDRFGRCDVMLFADTLRFGALLALGVLSLCGALEIWHIAVLSAFYGAGSAFFGPAFEAMIPDLVPESQLTQANSFDQLVRPMAMRLLGPALGGWIIAAAGVGWAFIADASSFAVSIGCLLHLRRSQLGLGVGRSAAILAPIKSEIREGFVYVRSNVWLWGTFAAATFAYLAFLGPSEVLLPLLLKNDLGGSASDFGTVLAIGGFGSIVASVVMAQSASSRQSMTFIYSMWVVSTLGIACYGLARLPWHVMLACFAFHAFETAGLVAWTTAKQTIVPRDLLGRVASLDLMISTALMPISYASTGPVAHWLGTRETLIVAGLLGSAITLSFLFLPGMRGGPNAAPSSENKARGQVGSSP